MEEKLSDITVFEKKDKNDASDEVKHFDDDNVNLKEKHQNAKTAKNVTYLIRFLSADLEKVLLQLPRVTAAPEHEVAALKLLHQLKVYLR